MSHRVLKAVLFSSAILTALPAASLADDVTDEIDRAKKSYEEGKIAEAKTSLELAAQLIGQQKAKALQGILPQPLAGWSAKDSEPSSTGASMFGGGITAGRTFEKDDKSCIVNIVGDSPMLAMVSMVLSNPSMASMSGARVLRIADQRAMITQNGEVQLMSANNYLVNITGDCEEEDKIAYAGAVDYKKLAGF